MHKPNFWVVVGQSDHQVTLSAGCTCGDEECNWTLTTYARPDGTIRGNVTNTLEGGGWREPDGTEIRPNYDMSDK